MANFQELFNRTRQKLRELTNKVARLKHEKELEEEESRNLPVPKEKSHQAQRIEISSATIAKVFFIAVLFWAGIEFVSAIQDVIIIFFVSMLFAAALDPMVDAMERRKIPRWLGVLIVYAVLFFFLGIFIGNIVPLLASELADLAGKIQDFLKNVVQGNITFPGFMEGIRPLIQKMFEGVDLSRISTYQDLLLKFSNELTSLGKNVVSAVIVISNGVLNFVLVLILTFLMIWDEKGIDKFILSLFPARYGKYITEKSNAIKEKVGQWLRGQVALMVIVGLLTALGFFILNIFGAPIKYAATLAMVAGLLEVVPYIGPVLSWIISVPIVANQSFTLVLWVTLVFIIVQQFENNVIVPLVMKKAVGLNPILSIIALLIGFDLLGVLGMLLAIPVTTAISVFVKDYAQKDK